MNPSRVRMEAFVKEAAASVGPGALMLDAGSGDGQYRIHFAHARYESADFGKVDKGYDDRLTYTCELHAIPVEDSRYEMVLLTQVLEHLSEPSRVLGELNRVLKPGGQIWLSAPLYYEEHEQPYDFYRYTQFGFRYLLGAAGFEVERLEWLEGYYGTLSYQFGLAARHLPRRPGAYGGGAAGLVTAGATALARPLLRLLSGRLAAADLRVKMTSGGHCKNYCVVARKPG